MLKLQIPFPFFIWITGAGIVSTVALNFTGVYLDVRFPQTNWDTPKKAMKNNYNGLLNFAIAAAIALLVFGIWRILEPLALALRIQATFWSSIVLCLATAVIAYLLAVGKYREGIRIVK